VAGAAELGALVPLPLPLPELEPEPEPELEPEPEPLELVAPQLPWGGPNLLPLLTTSGPGLGYSTSTPSATVQPLLRLATKTGGR
jgi:hypothetical protein